MAEKETRGGRPSKRNDILVAAEQLVKEQGPAQLTFDRLSEETGISKGGLLYHFASKEDLVLAMMDRMIESREALHQKLQQEMDEPDAFIKSLIIAEAGQASGDLATDSAILCAASTNRDLLTPIRGRFKELLEMFDKSAMGGNKARIAFYAVYGERLMQQVGIIEDNSEERARFIEAMKEYIL